MATVNRPVTLSCEGRCQANYLALFSPGSETLNISTNTATTIKQLLEELSGIIGINLKPTLPLIGQVM